MLTEAVSSDQDDPLHALSYLSLFPHTCRNLALSANPTDLSDLQLIHNVLKTMALKEPGRSMEQAKRILESRPEDMKSEIFTNAAVREDVGVINEESVRERRAGLGRKQAKFHFNRKIGQSAVFKEPTLDIAKLDDPVEFFLAHERLENAKKEIRKQKGILTEMEVNINDLSLTARPRRPGIPGRVKSTYKHRCSYFVLDDDDLKESSMENAENTSQSLSPFKAVDFLQETLKENHTSPSNNKMHTEAFDPIKDGVLGDSVSKANRFLDDILSGTYDHLNSDGQLTLLQEQLQIKPLDINKLSLPKLPDFPKYDFKNSGNFSKPRKSLPDIQEAFSGMGSVKPTRIMHTPSFVHLSASPLPKSPLANLVSLKKHIMQSNRSADSFSTFNTDPHPVGGSSPLNYAEKQPESVIAQGDSRCKLNVNEYDEEVSAVLNMSSNREELQDSRDFLAFEDDTATAVIRTRNILPNQPGSALSDKNGIPVEPDSWPESYEGSRTNELSDTQMQSENATQAINSLQPDLNMDDQHSSPGAGFHATQSAGPSLGTEQHKDIQVKNVLETSVNKERRRKTVPVHKTNLARKKPNLNGHPQRISIAAVGTDTQQHEPGRDEVQAECAVANMSSTQPDLNLDKQGPSTSPELLEKQSKPPEISPEQERVEDVTETSMTNESNGKYSPLKEQNESVELCKKQKRKGGADSGAQATDSRDNQCRSYVAELHDEQAEVPNNHQEQLELEEHMGGNIPKTLLTKQKEANVPYPEQMEYAEEETCPRKKPKRKECSLRKSIAVAGTSMQSGVRRSTRHKMRPLEFWRGERFLYGRLAPDSTLPTLIGVKKYSSPARQEGKAVLEVVAYVDGEKYRELIDLASLH
uniref:Centromere protein C n=1 Tax=Kalanchoe fedtschenkoi TaxID=63787 RepID=A0A7N0TT41_KALFE